MTLFQIIAYLCIRIMFHNLTTKTMDKTLISGKDLLFAYCVTDGMLDDMTDEQRTSIILALTESKKKILKGYQSTDSDRKNTKKVSK